MTKNKKDEEEDEEEEQQSAAANFLVNLEYKKPPGQAKPKNLVKGYKPMDNRQVTHNLRRRMGR